MRSFTDIWQYMPHGMCLLWQPWLVMLWAGSDLLIFLSYSAIPIALLTVLKRRNDVPHRGLVVLFASFILLCGLTHLLSIVTLWYPIYPWVGVVKLWTGLVSAATAIVLFRLIPTLVNLPSPAALEDANARLRDEIAAHERTLSSLETQVADRTEELREANDRLSVQAREAVHRSANLLSVVGSLVRQSARDTTHTEEFIDQLNGRLHALALATATVMRDTGDYSGDLDAVVRTQLKPLLLTYGERVTIAGAPMAIVSEAAQQVSLALHELATNAQKYNLSHSDDTRVELSWHEENHGADQTIVLTWDETLAGHGATLDRDRAEAEGFGTKLLLRVVPQMLRGTAERIIADDRLTYRLAVPASAILARPKDGSDAGQAARLTDENFGLA